RPDRDRVAGRGHARWETRHAQPRRRGVANLELERFHAPEPAAREARDHVDAISLVDRGRELRPAEGDPVEDVSIPAEHELAVAACRFAGPDDGQAEDRDEWLGIARSGGLE